MSKELKKLYKTAVLAMNYFFLKIIFEDNTSSANEIEKNGHLYNMIKCELSVFLDNLVKEKDIAKDIITGIKEELIAGQYLDKKSMNEIEDIFDRGLSCIFDREYPELVDFYMDIVKDIKKEAI